MRAPKFWSYDGWASKLLQPLATIYAGLTAARVARAPRHRSRSVVISVGNINVGGTGKTPTVVALVEIVQALGKKAQIVSRGYGGKETGPLLVDPAKHSAAQVGDEPLLLAAFAPVWVAKDRVLGVLAAEMDGADVIILDDAHQNPDIHKDLSIIVVDALTGFGNGRVMPAGPLREPVNVGMKRGDLLISIGRDAEQKRFASQNIDHITIPHQTAELRPLEMGMEWRGLRVFAFAGIGRPEKFFTSLEEAGAEVVGRIALDDHQEISKSLFARIQSQAAQAGAQLITTEKDAARLPRSARGTYLTFPVRLILASKQELSDRIAALLPKA